MTIRLTTARCILASIAIWLFLAAPASAQYTWTVTAPVAGTTYPVGAIPFDASCTWITQMSKAVSRIDVIVKVAGVQRPTEITKPKATQSSSGQTTTYEFKGSIKVATQNPNSPASVAFTAFDF